MSKQNKFIVIVLTAIVLVVGLSFLFGNKKSQYDQLANCIKDSGAKFYGTFWCSHCQNQKKMFESASKYLPYVECSSKDGQKQLEVCTNQNIQAYPTWIFADQSRLSGELSFQVLAEKTSCALPL